MQDHARLAQLLDQAQRFPLLPGDQRELVAGLQASARAAAACQPDLGAFRGLVENNPLVAAWVSRGNWADWCGAGEWAHGNAVYCPSQCCRLQLHSVCHALTRSARCAPLPRPNPVQLLIAINWHAQRGQQQPSAEEEAAARSLREELEDLRWAARWLECEHGFLVVKVGTSGWMAVAMCDCQRSWNCRQLALACLRLAVAHQPCHCGDT